MKFLEEFPIDNEGGWWLVVKLSGAPTPKILKYSQFIQKLKQGKIENVGVSADRTHALVEAKDGTKMTVNLPPNDDRLVNILTENVKGNI